MERNRRRGAKRKVNFHSSLETGALVPGCNGSCFPLAVCPEGSAVFNALKQITFSSLNTEFGNGRKMEKSLALVLNVFVLEGRITGFRRPTDKLFCLNG